MPKIEAHTRPTKGGSNHGAAARVTLPRHSKATSTIGGPISIAGNSSASSGRGSTWRHNTTMKHSPNHASSAPSTRHADQRHSKPMAGIAGHRCTSATTSIRLGVSMFSPAAKFSIRVALLRAISADRPMSSSVRRHPARRLAASVTARAGSSAAAGATRVAATGVEATSGALISASIAAR